jgi:hypothetical protein
MRRSGSRSNSVAPRTLAPSRFPHRNCASVCYYCNKARPALQRIPARFSIARSELHREQHPGTLACQKGACILAVVPHVLQALVLHVHHSTGRMRPADFSPACPIHARDRYADLDRRKQPALASLACTSLRGLHCTLQSHHHAMSLPCAIGTRRAFHHVLRTVSACLRESSS